VPLHRGLRFFVHLKGWPSAPDSQFSAENALYLCVMRLAAMLDVLIVDLRLQIFLLTRQKKKHGSWGLFMHQL
jgi:hypothetical protein